jgi:hypothetical protein
MQYLGEAPLELPLSADPGIIFFLFFSSTSATAFIIFLLINGRTCQLIVRQIGKLYQALLEVDGESCMVQVGLFLICVDVI